LKIKTELERNTADFKGVVILRQLGFGSLMRKQLSVNVSCVKTGSAFDSQIP